MTEPILLDLSHHNGEILAPEKMLENGVVGVYIKCTQGDYFEDPKFAKFWGILKAAAIPVSVYIFLDPKISAKKHLEKFQKTFADREPDMPVALDCEYTANLYPNAITSVIQNLMLSLSDWQSKYFPELPKPIVYTRASWWNPYVLPWSGWKQFGLWVARYMVDLPWYSAKDPYKVRDWDTWVLHQYSADENNDGRMFGLTSRAVDKNRPTREFLEKYIRKLNQTPDLPNPEPETPKPKIGRVAVWALNVRSGAGIKYSKIGAKYLGEQVEIYAEIQEGQNVWVQIDGDGKQYCAKIYNGYQYIMEV
jgi:GH25 family lysozyme M1 (1,4-beta-N-acetylmuramidase)